MKPKGRWVKVGAVLALLAIAMFVVIDARPSQMTITRSAKIDAPPAAVFAEINDLHKWQAWSPWAKLDPQAKNEFAGPTAGKDSSFTWSGNDEVGAGTMTITESKPAELVKTRLDFKRPMQCVNYSDIALKPDGDGTLVTWTMTGKQSFMAKAFGLFVNVDKLVGDQFDEGLKNLNEVVAKK